MKIELKRIIVNERLSQESNCFVADLYIEGKKLGKASNLGDGESTSYVPNNKAGWTLIKEAAIYCESLPPQKTVFDGEHLEFKRDLSTFLDELVERHIAVKALKAFSQKVKRGTGKAIVYGEPDPDFLVLRFKRPFSDITSFRIWKEELVENIRSTVKPVQVGDGVLYATNMPEEMCKAAGLEPLANFRKGSIKTNRNVRALLKKGKKI